MARPRISVLLIEDDSGDATRVEVMLRQSEDAVFDVHRAESLMAGLTVISARRPDVTLLDLSLPDFQGYDTVVEFVRRTSVPFVVLTGNDDMQMAMRCVSLGAQDYVLKGSMQPKPLERSILMSLKRSSNERVRREMDEESRAMISDTTADDVRDGRLRAMVSRLIEAIEDVQSYVRTSAPGIVEDVDAILEKHSAPTTITALRDTMRTSQESGDRKKEAKRRPLSDQALRMVDSLIDSRSDASSAEQRLAAQNADHDLLEILHRRESNDD